MKYTAAKSEKRLADLESVSLSLCGEKVYVVAVEKSLHALIKE
jgi:hypothetical protein